MPKRAEKQKMEKEYFPDSFHDLIDSYTENIELREALKEYLEVRKMKKVALTDKILEWLLEILDGIASSDEEKIFLVKKAVINGWKCFYPLRSYEKKILLEINESQISDREKEVNFEKIHGIVKRTNQASES